MMLGLALMAVAGASPLAWLEGRWCTEPGAEQVCESWAAIDGDGVMRGASEAKGGVTERMTITAAGGQFVFHAEPQGQAPADFVAKSVEGQAVVFLNPAHDYPQRVRYWREGALLMAEIAMADGSKPARWTYRRAR